MVDEPLDYERRFFGSSANTVEHEHQQDVEFSLLGIFFNELDLVTVIGADLEAGYASFLLFQHNAPTHSVCKVSASLSLHRNIRLVLTVVILLLIGGHSI